MPSNCRREALWNVDAMRSSMSRGIFGAAGSRSWTRDESSRHSGAEKGARRLRRQVGKVLWTATADAASYSSGVATTIEGRRYAIFLTREALVGLDPATGEERFRRPWRARQAASVNAATPLVIGTSIFVSAEYGPGAGVLRFDGTRLVDVWSSNDVLSNHYATSVYHEGRLFGFHGRQEFGPVFRAVDFQSSKVLWSTGRFGAGTVLLAGNRLLIVRETGELVIAAPAAASFQQIASASILPPTVRAYPALPTVCCMCGTTTRWRRWISDDAVPVLGAAVLGSMLGSGFCGSQANRRTPVSSKGSRSSNRDNSIGQRRRSTRWRKHGAISRRIYGSGASRCITRNGTVTAARNSNRIER